MNEQAMSAIRETGIEIEEWKMFCENATKDFDGSPPSLQKDQICIKLRKWEESSLAELQLRTFLCEEYHTSLSERPDGWSIFICQRKPVISKDEFHSLLTRSKKALHHWNIIDPWDYMSLDKIQSTSPDIPHNVPRGIENITISPQVEEAQ
ncbi:hypothetical protein M422DRAFT_32154 [Sphaerobolus stellatus SS14]|uniref:Uncharacterized protein n=1 Tax=Sphaerobolus stellatus (strain SS14) TaxID=990650 RepID=A0A0C9UC95_SPHS4|nr:hypothetical protein M422DRAFT_32154 [Sphaerobolus stellatus SS14]